MEDYDTPEDESNVETIEEGEGSWATTGAVLLLGTVAGIGLTRGYDKVKTTVLTRLAERREAQTQELAAPIEANATEAE